ncbi:uracil-DNA glycosylase [Candidatus Peribacteria bacterium]|nr:uracil-DNA glycosylase [Candidatus Peribacteria bacterium]
MPALTLPELQTQLREWKGCALYKTATQAVLGEGNPQAEVMFIGEAPGQKEDEQGRPFVGPAGQFLDELLGTIGLKRADVYISNVVKYRPPQNRDPTPEEKEQCMPWLKQEIAIIKPKVIVPLGRHALGHFFTKLSITEGHGKPQILRGVYPEQGRGAQDDKDSITVFPIYHPAAALHNGGLRQALYDDFKALGKFLEERKTR